MTRAASLEDFFDGAEGWGAEMRALRDVLARTDLTETFKWRAACYCWKGANVAIIGGFKDGCRLGFFKGVLLADPEGVLIAAGPRSRSSMYLQFQSVEEVTARAEQIMRYAAEAIAVEDAGKTVVFAKDDLEYPEELVARLASDEALRRAFDALTPGRRRGYLLHFSDAKRSQTRIDRIERMAPRILAGKGMQDR